jgi:hypothetical protein
VEYHLLHCSPPVSGPVTNLFQVVGNGTPQLIPFIPESDPFSFYFNNVFIVPFTGLYDINVIIFYQAIGIIITSASINIFKNGTFYRSIPATNVATTTSNSIGCMLCSLSDVFTFGTQFSFYVTFINASATGVRIYSELSSLTPTTLYKSSGCIKLVTRT